MPASSNDVRPDVASPVRVEPPIKQPVRVRTAKDVREALLARRSAPQMVSTLVVLRAIYRFLRQDDCMVGQTTPDNHKLTYPKHFRGPLTDDILHKHLTGYNRIFCFPIHPDGSDHAGQLQALIVDFDDHGDAGTDEEMDARWAALATRAMEFEHKLIERGVRPFRMQSAGKQGGHVGVFLPASVEAACARRHMLGAMAEAGLTDGDGNATDGEARLFPARKSGPTTAQAPGTPVALPFWGGATALTPDWSDAQDQNGRVPMPETTPVECLLALPLGEEEAASAIRQKPIAGAGTRISAAWSVEQTITPEQVECLLALFVEHGDHRPQGWKTSYGLCLHEAWKPTLLTITGTIAYQETEGRRIDVERIFAVVKAQSELAVAKAEERGEPHGSDDPDRIRHAWNTALATDRATCASGDQQAIDKLVKLGTLVEARNSLLRSIGGQPTQSGLSDRRFSPPTRAGC